VIDGHRITSLVSAFFLFHLPEIVKQGRLYKAVSPLYSLKDKSFVMNKKDYIKLFESKINKHVQLTDINTNKILKRVEMQEFLFVNRTYADELKRVSNNFGVHSQLIEFVIAFKHHKDFSKLLDRRFPEIKYRNNIVSGIHDGEYQNLINDTIFDKGCRDLSYLIHNQNKQFYYKLEDHDGYKYRDLGIMSIGDIMEHCKKYQPSIQTRFKGLIN
jgi:DNA gyrase/topoisomerase IV subunit B